MPNSAPVIANLNGDGVTYDAGGAPVRLDALADGAISDADPYGFEVIRVGTGFSGGPLFALEVPDGSGRMYVVEKTGLIRILDPATGTIAATPFLDVTGQVATTGEQGLLGFTLAPDFVTSGVFYIYMTNTGGDNEVRRYSILPGNMSQADAASADRILLLPHPGASNHNAGWIGFGPDGMLYIPTGDGAVGANAQSLSSLLGKVLRIDPSSDAFPADADRDYAIPASNPYAGATPGLDEIWASGLRNPFRASFDALTGNLWIGDVGEGSLEEIDLAPNGQAGLNFGWNLQEGTNGADNPAFTRPVAEYSHGSGPFQGNSVTGGLVYRGPIAGLDGHYLFADYFDEVWSVPVSSLVQGSTLPSSGFTLRDTAFTPNAGTVNSVTSFATDAAGNLYMTDLGGEVFRVQPSAAPNFAGGRLTVEIGAGEVPAEDRLGFATGSVTLSNGTNFGSQVSVGGVLVGTIAPGGSGANGEPLVVLFSSGATQARISTLVQAVTYSNVDPTPTPGTRSIAITLNDGAGTGSGGQDTTIVTTAVAVSAGAGGQLTGTAGNDTLVGGSGDDTLVGRGGADHLQGGAGSDTADYSTSLDRIAINLAAGTALGGDAHLDVLVGIENLVGTNSSATDFLTGDGNVNILSGLAGDDILAGRGGADQLLGGAGTDTADYSASADRIAVNLAAGTALGGDAHGDVLIGIENLVGTNSALTDFLTGDGNANLLRGLAGDDELRGAGGGDTLVGGTGADLLDGGTGNDTADYSASVDRIAVNLTTGAGLGGDAHGDALAGIENLVGTNSSIADFLTGDGNANILSGLAGDDILAGRGGADRLEGGAGSDTADYSASVNRIAVNLAGGTALGGDAHDDVLVSIENLVGTNSTLADFLTGDGNANILRGLAGDDTLRGLGSDDTLSGGSGSDVLDGGEGNDTLLGDDGLDVLTGGGGVDTFQYRTVSATAPGTEDRILDFQVGTDKIDLAFIDANAGAGGDQAFAFIGSAAFSGTPGELRAELVNGYWHIRGDTNGDGAADLVIYLTALNADPITAGDFIA